MNRLRVADFFCGAGGFSEGFRQMGFDVVFGLDNWQPAIDTHNLNHPCSKSVKMDILNLSNPDIIDDIVPDTEVIIGSPPCVAFSGSNKAGKAEKGPGIILIEAFFRIVAWKLNKPGSILKYWIMENVPNSQHYIKDSYSFEELGLPGGKKEALKIRVRNIMNAADYGAPQGRIRFFCGDYPQPRKEHDDNNWIHTSKVLDCLTDPLKDNNIKQIIDPIYGFKVRRSELKDHFYDTTVEEWEWKRAKRLKEDHGYMGKMSFPEDLDRPSRTIMATRSGSTREAMIFGGKKDKNGNWQSYRMPTIREIASLMSFPLTYQFEANNESSKYRLVGNAVCVKHSSALAKSILENEGLKPPESFIPLEGKPKPTFDLTGMKRKRKKEGPRNPKSKYARHIPYMKIRGFRVELDNKKSDFDKDKIRWSATLHQGTGKKPLKCECKNDDFLHLISDINRFNDFKNDLNKKIEDGLPDAKTLQQIYCNPNGNKDQPNPDDLIYEIKDLIDEYYPPDEYEDSWVYNDLRAVKIPREKIPLRIMMGQYALNEYVEKINSS